MLPDDPALPTPPAATPTPIAIPVRRAIPVRHAMPCCVRQAQRPAPAITAHLRAAAIWAALLRPPEAADHLAED